MLAADMVNPTSTGHSTPIKVEVVALPKTEIERHWRDLEVRANPSFFLSWSWIGTLLELADFVPNLLVARSSDHVVGLGLVAIRAQGRFGLTWPALFLNETGVSKFDCVMIEDNGFLAEAAMQESVTAASLCYLLKEMPQWRELRLGGVPTSFLRIAQDLSMPIARNWVRPSPIIELASGVDNLASVSSNTRQQIRRSYRLYRERGEVTVTPSANFAEVIARFSEMEKLHRHRWSGTGTAGAFSEPFFARFHRTLITRAFSLGQVDVLRVAVGSETLGLLYTFFYRGDAYLYQNGFRYETDSRLKPGLVSHIQTLEYCKGRGIVRYRLLAGDSRYKRSLATDSYPLHWLSIRRPHLAFRLEAVARRILGRFP